VELLNAIELDRAAKKHPQARAWPEAWRTVVLGASWQSLADVKKLYPAADGVVLGGGRRKSVVTVFNAGGDDYRLLTRIGYQDQLVQVVEVLMHAEYSKDKWKKRYA